MIVGLVVLWLLLNNMIPIWYVVTPTILEDRILILISSIVIVLSRFSPRRLVIIISRSIVILVHACITQAVTLRIWFSMNRITKLLPTVKSFLIEISSCTRGLSMTGRSI